jgi:LAO/AO transport system kinase
MSLDLDTLARQIPAGNRRALSRAITLIESTRPDHREAARGLLERLAPRAGGALRIGISGAPGVGKSTFIEALGNYILDRGHRLAVLAVDPSSSLSGGSILGDKTRMELLSRRPEAFIRPSPAGKTLGGVTRRTRETLLLCEAAGFDVVIVETVGVGQSETVVADMTDMFLLLLLPGGGDELQGIKRGIMELADLILVNKADGEMAGPARHSAGDYRSALRLIRPRVKGWQVPVKTCSARKGRDMGEIWSLIGQYREQINASGELRRRRAIQAKSWMWEEISAGLLADFSETGHIKRRLSELEASVSKGVAHPAAAAAELLELFHAAQPGPR